MDKRKPTFRILALAPFSPQQNTVWSHDFLKVSKDSLDEAIGRLKPFFQLEVSKEVSLTGTLEIEITDLKGFRPDNLVKDNPYLAELVEAKAFLDEAISQGFTVEQIKGKLRHWPHLPYISIAAEKTAPVERENQGVANILKLVALPDESNGERIRTHSPVHQVDHILKMAMEQIFADENFKCTEGIWRGVRCVLNQGPTDGSVELELLPVNTQTMDETLEGLTARLLADPPAVIIVDLPFDSSAISIDRLHRIGEVAETVLCPAVCAINPDFFYLESWDELKTLPYLTHFLDGQAFAKWRNLAAGSPGRWLAVACNRFLTRYPYGPENQTKNVRFNEQALLYTSSVWAVASLVAQSVRQTGWPTAFSQWQHIRLEDLPLPADKGRVCTEVQFDEERIAQFIEAGILPLVAPVNKDFVFMPGDTTVRGDSLSYQILVSRISHFVLWLKDQMENDLSPQVLKDRMTQAFALFWESTGHPKPEDLDISVGALNDQQRIPIKITLSPSRRILASCQPVELEFNW